MKRQAQEHDDAVVISRGRLAGLLPCNFTCRRRQCGPGAEAQPPHSMKLACWTFCLLQDSSLHWRSGTARRARSGVLMWLPLLQATSPSWPSSAG